MSVFSKIKKAAKTVKKLTKSPIVKAGIAGACVVCPAVGAPLAAGVALSAKLSDAATKGNPKQKAAAKKLLVATAAQAKKGDPGATRMLKLVAAHTQAANGNPEAKAAVAKAAQVAQAELKRDAAAKKVQDGQVLHVFHMMKSGRIKKVS